MAEVGNPRGSDNVWARNFLSLWPQPLDPQMAMGELGRDCRDDPMDFGEYCLLLVFAVLQQLFSVLQHVCGNYWADGMAKFGSIDGVGRCAHQPPAGPAHQLVLA